MADEEEKIKFDPDCANDWRCFLEKTIELDKEHEKIRGWHWFWGICYLQKDNPNFNRNKIIDALPDKHWVKIEQEKINEKIEKISDVRRNKAIGSPATYMPNPRREAYNTINEWTMRFKMSKEITKIIFFEGHSDQFIDFSNIIFPVDADFRGAVFAENAIFENAVFLKTADFKNAIFNGKAANFNGAVFKKIADFSDAIFEYYPDFKNSEFNGRTIFQQAKFKRHAPRFYEAKLSKEITWDNVGWPEFPNIFWILWQDILRLIKSKRVDKKYTDGIRENQNAYEDLAYQMEKLGKYHDHHLFFRNEMGCRRRRENYFTRFFYWSYEKLANYGYGVGHAFCYWLAHIVAWGVGLYFFVFCNKGIFEGLKCSLITSITNAHSFLLSKGMGIKSCYEDYENTFAFNLIWALESISGAMFLFLVLLTLRVRFRLK